MVSRALPLITFLSFAAPLGAHPHIFVDTGLDLHFDTEGRLIEVHTIWAYDEFYSLLITEDRSLDPDFDGILTPEELADLQGFDMQWTEGFNGDLVIKDGDRIVPLSGPLEYTATYENARITTTHVRKVLDPVTPAGGLELRPYDPTYYTAYDITLPVRIEGNAACRHRMDVPDIAARLQEVSAQLAAMDTITDDEPPDVGIFLATTVTVTCDMP